MGSSLTTGKDLEVLEWWDETLTPERVLSEAGESAGWLKLPRHIRSRCRPRDGGFLYLKGFEPLEADYARLLASLARRRDRGSSKTFLHHFSHYERKIPAALRMEEAREEARAARHLQSSAQRLLGRTVNLPRPVGLWRLNAQAKTRLWETLKPHLEDEAAVEQCAGLLAQDEIALYAYRQDSSPHRLDDYLDQRAWTLLAESHGAPFEPMSALRQWLHLFMFCLRADVLATHPAAVGLGSPIDVGNLCLSGGFADLGTVCLDASARDGEYQRASLALAWEGWQALAVLLFRLPRLEALHLVRAEGSKLREAHPELRCELVDAFLAACP